MSAKVIHSIAELREVVAAHKSQGQTIGFVPTMGALHAGHIQLVEAARRETDCVVVSIFVNPIQFNQQEDFDKYPRTLETDVQMCSAAGTDVVFVPTVAEFYPPAYCTYVDVEKLTDNLCGKFRPGHFRGVATVVLKLFNMVGADRAYFGEKDAQQLAVIRRMVEDLNVPVEIVGIGTVREHDGLALSSRNLRLSPEHRAVAPILYRALETVAEAIAKGVSDAEAAKKDALQILKNEPQFQLEYLEIVDPGNLQPVASDIGTSVRVMVAAWIGGVRLIDNILVNR